IDVIDLGVALATTDAQFRGVLGRFDINTLRRARGRAQKTGDALFEAVLIPLQLVDPAKTLLKLRGRVRVILGDGRVEHLAEGDAHAFDDGGGSAEYFGNLGHGYLHLNPSCMLQRRAGLNVLVKPPLPAPAFRGA